MKLQTPDGRYTVETSDTKLWINTMGGECIARYSMYGHNEVWSSGRTTNNWTAFKNGVARYLGIALPDMLKPEGST